MNLWTLVGRYLEVEQFAPEQRSRPSYALAVAWNAAAITPVWQKLALANTPDGRAANDRLDVAMSCSNSLKIPPPVGTSWGS